MTNLFLDTEFTDNARCDLISMGIVDEAGKAVFYGERHANMEWCNDFVVSRVLPQLEGNPLADDEFAARLAESVGRYHNPVMVADWPDDLALFFRALATFGRGFKRAGKNLTISGMLLRNDAHDADMVHHALKDALILRNAIMMKGA